MAAAPRRRKSFKGRFPAHERRHTTVHARLPVLLLDLALVALDAHYLREGQRLDDFATLTGHRHSEPWDCL